MARVTVEDCVRKIPNRFELVTLAAQRARSLASGAESTIEIDNDKNAVIALREIAEETISIDDLKEDVIHHQQKVKIFHSTSNEEQVLSEADEEILPEEDTFAMPSTKTGKEE